MKWARLEQGLQSYRKSRSHPATRFGAGPYITAKFSLLTLCGLIASSCDGRIRLIGWIIAPASVVDSLMLNTAIAFCAFEEARPKSVLRSVLFAFATFWNMAIAFAVLYVLVGTQASFLRALYFSVLTVMTIGGDRVAALDWPASALVVLQLMIGLYFLAVILTVLVTWAGKKTPDKETPS